MTGLKFNQFAIDKVEYLGHVVTSEGVKPDSSKIKAIRQYPRSKNVKEIWSFVGLASNYHRHVPNFADIALPLTKLTKKNEQLEDEQEKAFQELKDILSTEPLLVYPDFSQPFIVYIESREEENIQGGPKRIYVFKLIYLVNYQ